MNCVNRIAMAAGLAAFSALAAAQGAPPGPPAPEKTAIEARQGLLKVVSSQNAPVAAMLRGTKDFDAAIVAKSAARIQALSEMIPDLFALDTRQYKDVKTLALDGIWNSQADFKSKADALNKAAGALVEAAKGGDKATTLAAYREVGKACSGCHDNYRAKP